MPSWHAEVQRWPQAKSRSHSCAQLLCCRVKPAGSCGCAWPLMPQLATGVVPLLLLLLLVDTCSCCSSAIHTPCSCVCVAASHPAPESAAPGAAAAALPLPALVSAGSLFAGGTFAVRTCSAARHPSFSAFFTSSAAAASRGTAAACATKPSRSAGMLCEVQTPHLLPQLCRHPGRVSTQVCLQQVGSSSAAAAWLHEVLCLWPQPGSRSSTVALQLPGEASSRQPSAHVTLWVWPHGKVTDTASVQLTRERSDLLRCREMVWQTCVTEWSR